MKIQNLINIKYLNFRGNQGKYFDITYDQTFEMFVIQKKKKILNMIIHESLHLINLYVFDEQIIN